VPTASRFFEQPLAEQVFENALPDEVHDTPFPSGCQDFSCSLHCIEKRRFSGRVFGWMNNLNSELCRVPSMTNAQSHNDQKATAYANQSAAFSSRGHDDRGKRKAHDTRFGTAEHLVRI
jgi:hypothetical protein